MTNRLQHFPTSNILIASLNGKVMVVSAEQSEGVLEDCSASVLIGDLEGGAAVTWTPPVDEAQATPTTPTTPLSLLYSLLLGFLSFCLVRPQGGAEQSVGLSRTTAVPPARTQPHRASAQSQHFALPAVRSVSPGTTEKQKRRQISDARSPVVTGAATNTDSRK